MDRDVMDLGFNAQSSVLLHSYSLPHNNVVDMSCIFLIHHRQRKEKGQT